MGDCIPKAWIDAAAPALWLGVLETFPGWCGQRGLLADATTTERTAWCARLHARLNESDRERPAALVEMIFRIGALANDEGHAHAVSVLQARGLSPDHFGARLSPMELALAMYASRSDLFELALARKEIDEEIERYSEFFPVSNAPLVGHHTHETREALTMALRGFYRDRGHTGFGAVDVIETDDEVRLMFLHGRAPRTCGVIDEEEKWKLLSIVPDKHDVVIVDKVSGRLSVHARLDGEVRFLRELMGRVFFDDREHYVCSPIYTGQPLVTRGASALSVEGLEGIRSIVLRMVRVRRADGPVMDLRYKDLRDALGGREFVGGRVELMKFGVTLGERGQVRRVVVIPPNRIAFDRRLDEGVIRAFLQRNGFARYPRVIETLQLAA